MSIWISTNQIWRVRALFCEDVVTNLVLQCVGKRRFRLASVEGAVIQVIGRPWPWGRCDANLRLPGLDQTPITPSSAQSGVLNHSCYCGVRIEIFVPRQYHLSMSEANLDVRLQTSLLREAKSLMGYPLSFLHGRRPLKQTNVRKRASQRFA